ncbi:UvrD-helicase domain-containing protein [Akkermansiaceae bacterium]|nr:UvrD-helicase domain-containing protein [Akkermansiaceae bacterium]
MSAGFSIESLNKAQREAVLALNGPILILAGAGTGKTRTVTCRMSALLENGVDAENVLAVTFTNKSAAEMAERVMGMVGKKRGKALTVCTFHSLCLRILKRDIESLGYKKKFAVMAGGDQTGMIRQLIVRKGGRKINLKPAEVMSEISKAKNAELPLSGIEDDLIAEIAVAYQNELRAQNAVDFDDLLLLAERVLREYPEVRGYWQDKFRYVTVDEFQDTNSLQMKLLQQLVGEPYNICVVGDDDQSIYGWRGAQVANILQFERFFPNPKIIRLEENYRSTQAVLEVANSLIRHNVGRREKKLRPTIPGGDLVRLVSMPGDQEESEWIVSEIVMQREEGRVLEDFAILFRTNGQIRKMEEVLREEKIPYRMVGAQSFYDRKEVRDVLSYVQVLNQPELDIPLLRILNTPPRGIGNTTSMAALDCSREKDQSIWETLIDGDFLVQVSKKVRNSIQTFTGQVEEVRRSLVDGVHAGIAGLLNKKHQLSKKLKTLVAPTSDLKIIITEQEQAYRDLQNIRNTHPSLQKLGKDLAFWQQNQFSARTKKREFEIKQAADKIIEISTKIQRLSLELPEIREAQARITRSQKQIEELQGSLAEKSSEGQAILKELKIIEEQIKSVD